MGRHILLYILSVMNVMPKYCFIGLFPLMVLQLSCGGSQERKIPQEGLSVGQHEYDSLVSMAYKVAPSLLETPAESGSLDSNGCVRFRFSLSEAGFMPAKDFCQNIKIFNKDGSLSVEYFDVFDNTIVSDDSLARNGIYEGLDERLREYDTCKVSPAALADFLEADGWYDRKTGRSYLGEDTDSVTDGRFTYRVFNNVIADFFPADELTSYPHWLVVLLNVNSVPSIFWEKHSDGVLDFSGNKVTKESHDDKRKSVLRSVVYDINAENRTSSVRFEYLSKR